MAPVVASDGPVAERGTLGNGCHNDVGDSGKKQREHRPNLSLPFAPRNAAKSAIFGIASPLSASQ
jgi:hypothetical protein